MPPAVFHTPLLLTVLATPGASRTVPVRMPVLLMVIVPGIVPPVLTATSVDSPVAFAIVPALFSVADRPCEE